MAQLEAVALENLEAARYVTLGEHIWSSLLGPAAPAPRASLPPSAGCRSPGLGADGTAAMFAPRLLDFQKTKYARSARRG